MFNPTYPRCIPRRIRASVLLVACVCTQSVWAEPGAEPGAEHEALARIVHELQVLEPLIQEAEAGARADTRLQLRYDWLRQDLARIRHGIETHLEAAQSAPRTFAPLRGDYR